MNLLKQSTAATIKLGPFIDDTDGKTAETGLTISQADIRLSKNGGDIAQSHNSAGATHDELGYYDIPLDTTDTGTLGRLRVLVSEAGALPVWQDFLIVTANVFDTFCSTGSLNVNAASLSTDAITAASVKADAVTKIQSGLATPTNITAGTITTVTNLTNLPTMPTDWVTAAGLKADAVTEIQNGLATSAALDTVDANVDSILADTGTDGVVLASTQGAITWGQQKIIADVAHEGALVIRNSHSSGIGLLNSGNIAQLNDGGDVGVSNAGEISVLGFDSAIATASELQTVDDNVDAIKAKTDNLPASPAAVGSAMTLTAAYDKAKDDVLTPLGVVDGIVDAIKVQTDKIPATPASAGEYTTNIGAIKAKTDNLPLSPASSGEYTSALTAIQNDLDNPNQYKADVSNLALQATSLAIKGQTDKIPGAPAQTGEYNAALTAIQADLDNPTQYKADVSGLATQASVNAIPTTPLLAANYTAPDNASIAAILEDTGTTIPATLAGLATSTEVGAIALLGETVVDSYTVQDILKILAAKMVGKATGGSTATITYRGLDDASDVIIETVDSNGNRSAVTLTV